LNTCKKRLLSLLTESPVERLARKLVDNKKTRFNKLLVSLEAEDAFHLLRVRLLRSGEGSVEMIHSLMEDSDYTGQVSRKILDFLDKIAAPVLKRRAKWINRAFGEELWLAI
jgi:hypothetical protein